MKNVQSRDSTLISETVILEPLKSKDSRIMVLEPKIRVSGFFLCSSIPEFCIKLYSLHWCTSDKNSFPLWWQQLNQKLEEKSVCAISLPGLTMEAQWLGYSFALTHESTMQKFTFIFFTNAHKKCACIKDYFKVPIFITFFLF